MKIPSKEGSFACETDFIFPCIFLAFISVLCGLYVYAFCKIAQYFEAMEEFWTRLSCFQIPTQPEEVRQTAARVSDVGCPRSHSTRAISKAKIKTVKLTVVVVAGYLICSAPYVCIQLYTIFGNPTINMSKYTAKVKRYRL